MSWFVFEDGAIAEVCITRDDAEAARDEIETYNPNANVWIEERKGNF